MAAIIALILQVLPIILKLFGLVSGGAAVLAYGRLEQSGLATGDALQTWYVGGQGALAAALMSAGSGVDWFARVRERARQAIERGAISVPVSGLNLVAIVKLIGAFFRFVQTDPDAQEAWRELFGTKAAALDDDAVARLAVAIQREVRR